MATRATPKLGGRLYVELAFGIVVDKHYGVLGAIATARSAAGSQARL